MKNRNPFKVGDVVSFKEDSKYERTYIFKGQEYIVTSISGHCVYVEFNYKDEDWNNNMPPIPFMLSEDPFHYKAFEPVK